MMDPMAFVSPRYIERVSKAEWFTSPLVYKQWLDKNTVQVTHVNIFDNGTILVAYFEV